MLMTAVFRPIRQTCRSAAGGNPRTRAAAKAAPSTDHVLWGLRITQGTAWARRARTPMKAASTRTATS